MKNQPKKIKRIRTIQRPMTFPPIKSFRVILHNDNFHSFEWVSSVIESLCNQGWDKAKELTRMIHLDGKAAIFEGTRAECRTLVKTIRNRGADRDTLNFLNLKRGKPIKATIEKIKK